MVLRRAMLLALLMTLGAIVTPSTQAQGSGLAPIMSGQNLLGGFENGQWLDADTTASRLTGNERYRIYTAKGYAGTVRADLPSGYYPPCYNVQFREITPWPKPTEFVAFGGTWEPMPRPTRSHSTTSSVYRTAIADLLRTRGIANPDVRLTQVIRVDLEGDGVDEVLISATRISTNNPSVDAGDYSLVVLRKIIDDKVATIQLEANYYPQAATFVGPNRYTIAGILDLSGDGMMEVVVNYGYYEGGGASVFHVAGGNIARLMRGGCGF